MLISDAIIRDRLVKLEHERAYLNIQRVEEAFINEQNNLIKVGQIVAEWDETANIVNDRSNNNNIKKYYNLINEYKFDYLAIYDSNI
jgi:sensor domain CHASE-containing protein